MARRKLSEGKKNIIAELIEEYDIKTANDIQEALKDLLGGTIQEMLEAELDNHLGYGSYERSSNPDYRNGTKPKKLHSSYGEIPIDVPQDRDGDFEPKIVPKRKKDISEIEQKVISLSAKGLSTCQISSIVDDIYGFEMSDGMVSDITDKIIPKIEEWQNRPLSEVYPIVFIDCIHFSVRDEHIVKKLAAYIILGVNSEGYKEVLSITVGENESAKYWLGVVLVKQNCNTSVQNFSEKLRIYSTVSLTRTVRDCLFFSYSISAVGLIRFSARKISSAVLSRSPAFFIQRMSSRSAPKSGKRTPPNPDAQKIHLVKTRYIQIGVSSGSYSDRPISASCIVIFSSHSVLGYPNANRPFRQTSACCPVRINSCLPCEI